MTIQFPHIQYVGEQAKGLPYRTIALTKWNELHRHTATGPRHATLDVSDGVRIEIWAGDTNRIRITAGGTVYLESGFMNHYSVAPLNEGAYRCSQLLYGSEQTADYARSKPAQGRLSVSSDGAVNGEKLGERQSEAMAAGMKLTKQAPNGFSNEFAIYGDENLLLRKKCQEAVPASSYTGLLALYVQVLYGRKKAGYSAGETVASQYMMPELVATYTATNAEGKTVNRTLPLKHSGTDSHWIFCNDRWEYWLCQMSYGRAHFRKIKSGVGRPGKASPTTLSGVDLRKAHAAILADGVLTEDDIIVPCGIVIGDPLAYGWKANRDGSAVEIVTHVDDTAENPTFRTARHYRGTVLLDDNRHPIGMQVSQLSEDRWDVSWGQHRLYIPKRILARQEAVLPVDPRYLMGRNYPCTAPVYVLEIDGELAVVMLSGGAAGEACYFKGAGVNVAATVGSAPTTYSTLTASSQGPTTDTAPPDDTDTFGPNAGQSMTRALWKDWAYTSANLFGPPKEDSRTNAGSMLVSGVNMTSLTSSRWRKDYYQYVDYQRNGAVLLLIPFFDCNSVVSGTVDSISYTSAYHRWGTASFNVSGQFRLWTENTTPPYYGSWGSDGAIVFDDSAIGASPDYFIADADSETLPAATDYLDKTLVVNTHGTVRTADSDSLLYWNGVDRNNPYLNPSVFVSSTGQSFSYVLSAHETGRYEWPIESTTAVGWA